MKLKKFLLRVWPLIPVPKELKRITRKNITYIISKKFTVGVLGIITENTNNEEKILLFEHTYLEDQPWGLPGGGVKHENLRDALEREILEESNFEVKVEDLIAVIHENGGLTFLFRCSLITSSFQNDDGEVRRCGFFSLDRLPPVTRPHRIIIKCLTHETSEGSRFETSYCGYIDPVKMGYDGL